MTDVRQWVRLDLFNDESTRGHKTIDVKNEQKEQKQIAPWNLLKIKKLLTHY
jgi:hypothetical protein